MSEINEPFDELLERITTQKQTIQAYRDESREWREVAERAQAENTKLRAARDTWQENDAKLRELVRDMYTFMCIAEKLNAHIKLSPNDKLSFANRMRDVGMEPE